MCDDDGSDTPAATEQTEGEQAEQRYVDDLIERGEAVPEGEELPPGATHEIVEGEDDEPPKVVRKRYSIG